MNAGWETIMNCVAVEQSLCCCFSSFIPSGNSLGKPRKVICDYQDFFKSLFSNTPRERKSRHTISSSSTLPSLLLSAPAFLLMQHIYKYIYPGHAKSLLKDICGYFQCAPFPRLETGKVVWVLSFDH